MRYAHLVIIALVFVLAILPLNFQAAGGQVCGLNYQVLSDNGTMYGLADMYGFQGLPNQTRVTVIGRLLPSNGSNLPHPSYSYGGTIIVLVLQSSVTTQSWYSITVVQVLGTVTSTITEENNPAPAYQLVTVSGTIITANGVCVQPANPSLVLHVLSSLPSAVTTVAVFAVALFIIWFVMKKRKT
ncbi:MAG: hypothetical protein ABSF63_01645 [Candidatus Bathyarchaeia archaeon]|jgi:hypothetical protein